MLESVVQLENVNSAHTGTSNFSWRLGLTFALTIVLIMILDWIWWKYNVRSMGIIPTSKCSRHVAMASRILSALFSNTLADPNVCEYYLLF